MGGWSEFPSVLRGPTDSEWEETGEPVGQRKYTFETVTYIYYQVKIATLGTPQVFRQEKNGFGWQRLIQSSPK